MDPNIRTPAELGARIAEAREDTGLSQGQLADRLGIDRTSVVRLEQGKRKVSAGELAVVAHELARPIDWFVLDSPPSVVSRRRGPMAGHSSTRIVDLSIESAARDVRFLLERGILAWTQSPVEPVPTSHLQAEALAARVRKRLGLGPEPLVDLGANVERLGMVAFSVDLGDVDDGTCVELDGENSSRVGVALINGAQDPGRRRWTLAHELGHFLIGDAYVGEHPGGEIERYIDSFVSYVLMPRESVLALWQDFTSEGSRRSAIALSARYRTSWTAACSQLRNLQLVSHEEFLSMKSDVPTRGDYLAAGEAWEEELEAPYVPPRYRTAVLSAYARGELTSDRTLELLRGSIALSELPAQREPALEDLRSEFENLP
jgi:Zn-dependent peptidase ImmA (M78 family)/DNA-binding XRE family transcriptional regulator